MSKKKKWTGQFIVQDKWFLEAKKLGYRARSAFKLIEIQEKYNLIQPGMKVYDIASAPGSFMQVIGRIVWPEWFVLGVDIQDIKTFGKSNLRTLKADVFDFEKVSAFAREYWIETFDLITSDIAPNTTGITGVDQYRSIELNLAILKVADVFLRQGGNLVLKVFIGEDVNELIAPIKERYKTLRRMKPSACRDRSFEEYFICLEKK